MSKEIERRWLVSASYYQNDLLKKAEDVYDIIQGYLGKFSGMVVRVRVQKELKNRHPLIKDMAYLTLKSDFLDAAGTTRDEFEFPISLDDAYSLIDRCGDAVIHKVRYCIMNLVSYHVFEVDLYEDRYKGLRIAELEYTDPEDKNDPEGSVVVVPDWCLKEITGQKQYSNYELATNNYNLETLSNWDEHMKDIQDGKHKGVSMGCNSLPTIRGLMPLCPNAVVNNMFKTQKMPDTKQVYKWAEDQKPSVMGDAADVDSRMKEHLKDEDDD